MLARRKESKLLSYTNTCSSVSKHENKRGVTYILDEEFTKAFNIVVCQVESLLWVELMEIFSGNDAIGVWLVNIYAHDALVFLILSIVTASSARWHYGCQVIVIDVEEWVTGASARRRISCNNSVSVSPAVLCTDTTGASICGPRRKLALKTGLAGWLLTTD